MIDFKTLELPLDSSESQFELDPKTIEDFRKCFQMKESVVPLTVTCKSFSGLFELFERIEVDFRRLLHISQTFEYHRPLRETEQLNSKTKLIRSRERGDVTWLSFESRLWDQDCEQPVVSAYSTILVSKNLVGEGV